MHMRGYSNSRTRGSQLRSTAWKVAVPSHVHIASHSDGTDSDSDSDQHAGRVGV